MSLPTPNWSAVYGEVLTAAKISQLGANDDALSNGTGFSLNNNIIPAAALATNAIALGYAAITSDFSSIVTGGDDDITGLSVTVTVPAGGRKVQVMAKCSSLLKSGSAGDSLILKLKEGSTQLAESTWNIPGSNYGIGGADCVYEGTPSAGSHTYKAAVNQTTAGTVTVKGASTKVSFISVKYI